jgi:choline dehydrogenase-like flavoprotein
MPSQQVRVSMLGGFHIEVDGVAVPASIWRLKKARSLVKLLALSEGKTWTYHHPVGTCAMGVDPSAGAVVDPTCRLHGISGLRVVDASIMPDIPSANTHLPTIVIAERAAALIDAAA